MQNAIHTDFNSYISSPLFCSVLFCATIIFLDMTLSLTHLGFTHAKHSSPTQRCCLGHRNFVPFSQFAFFFSFYNVNMKNSGHHHSSIHFECFTLHALCVFTTISFFFFPLMQCLYPSLLRPSSFVANVLHLNQGCQTNHDKMKKLFDGLFSPT